MHSDYIKRFPYNSEICTDILPYIKGNIKSFRVHASSIHVSSSKKFDSNTFSGVRERAVGVTRRLPCPFHIRSFCWARITSAYAHQHFVVG